MNIPLDVVDTFNNSLSRGNPAWVRQLLDGRALPGGHAVLYSRGETALPETLTAPGAVPAHGI